ncbi:MAG: hypothetical protein AAGB97_09675 [Dehalococcoidia bacterium]|nr:hypothetical protein [Chloroflexota bacterium]
MGFNVTPPPVFALLLQAFANAYSGRGNAIIISKKQEDGWPEHYRQKDLSRKKDVVKAVMNADIAGYR